MDIFKNIFRLVFCLCYLSTSYCQNRELVYDSLMFGEILDTYHRESDPEAALAICRDFIRLYPSSQYTPRVYFNAACLYREIGNQAAAIPLFRKIIHDEDYDELEPHGGIMEEFALFKNRSSKNLAEIYLDLKDYENAYEYIILFDKIHKYRHFCGNELAANEIYTSVMYARYYDGVNKPEKSIRALVRNMVSNGLASNDQLLSMLRKLLLEKYSKSELYEIFEKAIMGITIRKKGYARMSVFGVNVKIYDDLSYYLNTANLDKLPEDKLEPYMSTLRANKLLQEFYFEFLN